MAWSRVACTEILFTRSLSPRSQTLLVVSISGHVFMGRWRQAGCARFSVVTFCIQTKFAEAKLCYGFVMVSVEPLPFKQKTCLLLTGVSSN